MDLTTLLRKLNLGIQEAIQTIPGSSSQSAPQQVYFEAPDLERINDYVHEVCKPAGKPSVEIVFFHGLQLQHSSSRDPHVTTWLSKDKSKFWLNWLETDFCDARIITISYDASMADMYITTENLLQCLTGFGAEVGQHGCPVVLVGHCLGGMIMKELCRQASSTLTLDPKNKRVENFLHAVKGLFFYGTPHGGLKLPDNHPLFEKGALFKNLKTLNDITARENEAFRKLRTQGKYSWKTFGVAENLPVTVGGFTGVLVPEGSARKDMDSYFTNVQADHVEVCRPDSPHSSCYLQLLDFVTSVLKESEARRSNKKGLLDGHKIVGLDTNVKMLVDQLDGAQGVRRLGIVGFPGTGKSTLAKAIFDKISGNFDYACFLPEVKKSMAIEENAEDLRDKIVENLRLKNKGTRQVNSHLFNWSTLEGEKVLIILDDAESESQVMVSSDEFSERSCVIVTSRNVDFLRRRDFEIHETKGLHLDDSRKLFSLHAFKAEMAPPEYEDRVTRFVNKCDGHPLALKVSGGYLYKVDEDRWDDALKKLNQAQPLNGSNDKDGLWSILKVSYESLAISEGEMFLDVATCFHGENLEDIQETWRRCSWASSAAKSGWQNLLDRCLVSEDEWGCISMHEVLRDLGRSIAMHSRMVVGVQEARRLIRKVKAATVKILIIDGPGYSFGQNDHLVDIGSLSGLKELEILWLRAHLTVFIGELRALQQLKIDGRGLDPSSLKALPNSLGLGQLQDLEGLQIRHFRNLIELTESIGGLVALQFLEISECLCLKALPDTLTLLTNLEHLTIRECDSLAELPKSIGQLSRLSHLEILECDSLNALPDTLGELQALQQLKITRSRLTVLPQSIVNLRELQHLEFIDCWYLEPLPPNILRQLEARKVKVTIDYTRIEPVSEPGPIVGLEGSIEKIVELLGGARSLGIFGMGGVGKTTLAKAVFDRISRGFEYTCFLDDVRHSTASGESPDHLKEKIVCRLKCRGHYVSNSFRWSTLRGKKILIFVEDVMLESQVALYKSDGFSEKSRIIVTSRDVSMLLDFDIIYNVNPLCAEDSLRLFCLHAFKEVMAPQTLQESVWRLVRRCDGIPLALTVLGKSLYGQVLSEATWDRTLLQPQSLARIPPNEWWSTLTLSYDSLANSEQQMFLDAASCFHGESLEEIHETWRRCSWASPAVESGWQNLLDTGWVNEDRRGCISVNELLREMGRTLYVGNSRMSVSSVRVACQLSEQEKATVRVLKIGYLKKRRIGYYPFNMDVICGFEKLEVLWLRDVDVAYIGELPALRLLKFESRTSSDIVVLPDSTLEQLQTLEYLHIIHSGNLTQFTESAGELAIGALRRLEIRCPNLRALPTTLGLLHNLEHLSICGCGVLTELPRSFAQLTTLRHLEILECESLKALPNNLEQLQALEKLKITSCSGLTMLPPNIGQLRALWHLDVSSCSGLTMLPKSIGQLRSLRQLVIRYCDSLEGLPNTLSQLQALEEVTIDSTYGGRYLRALPKSARLVYD